MAQRQLWQAGSKGACGVRRQGADCLVLVVGTSQGRLLALLQAGLAEPAFATCSTSCLHDGNALQSVRCQASAAASVQACVLRP